jgi:hypothetical protein
MAQVVAGSLKQRELPEWARKAFHKKLDELLAMYEAGHPLWLHSSASVTGASLGLQVDIYLKDWI